jgi:hypothetical protein
LATIEESRVSNIVLGTFKSTLLALIPNKDKPISFDGFLPISLCNLVYKTIINITAQILKQILSTFTSREQFGFPENRKINDELRVAQDGFDSIKTRKFPSMVIKIDL